MTADDEIKDMASMLLKGATMLSIHCGNCKSPLFERDGGTFCPKCGKVRIMTEEEAQREAEDKGSKGVDDKVKATLEKKRQDPFVNRSVLDKMDSKHCPATSSNPCR